MAVKSISTVVAFPPGTFLENIVVRHDKSFLLTVHTNSQLYYVPYGPSPVPVLLHTFEHNCLGIVETQPDVFYISTSTPEVPNSSALWRLDMNNWMPSAPLSLDKALDLPGEAKWLNGTGLLSAEKQVLLLADSFGAQIWRVDLVPTPSARVWLADNATMAHNPEGDYKVVPGINGVHFDEKSCYVYWTNSIKPAFARVKVDPHTLEPVGDVEMVASEGLLGTDDFIIDSDRGGAYIVTHITNTIVWLSFDGKLQTVAGEPIDMQLLGPTAAAWGREEGDYGKVFYVTTEGGIALPYEGKVHEGRLLRVEV